MTLLQIITLALVQGITEFLPISSSAHLVLVPALADWPDQGLAFDVALHAGSLIAVLIYFRREVFVLMRDWMASISGHKHTAHSRVAWAVLFGTIPVGLAGLLLNDYVENNLRSTLVIALATIGFGILLGIADRFAQRQRDEFSLGPWDVMIIGCAQALALIPGTSRSGITMTAGLLLGLERRAAARFSFLLSIPVIILAGGLKTVDLLRAPFPVEWGALALGTALSALSAYLCIALFLGFIERMGMWPFVVYRLLLGSFLLFYCFS